MYFIGIDLGTSAVKLLLMRENGAVEKIVSREYPLSLGIYITSKELHYYEQTLTPNCRRQCNF